MNFIEFMNIMKKIPTYTDIDNLCKDDNNYDFICSFAHHRYFTLLSPEQIYNLFTTACSHDAIEISKILFKQNIDLVGVKNLMLNYMSEVGSETEYLLFKWIWETRKIIFTNNEINECFINILKTRNMEFIQWFYSLDLINLTNIKNDIANKVLENATNTDQFIVASWICWQYQNSNSINTIS